MRRTTGEAVLASSPQLRPGGPTLSSLVSRIAESRGLAPAGSTGLDATARSAPRRIRRTPALVAPAPGLVTPPPVGRSVPTTAAVVGKVTLLGAHGGAGVTSLLQAGLAQLAVDAARCWPANGSVVIVARTSTRGLEWARDLARQHASGRAGNTGLLGLVLIADAPGRPSLRARELRQLVSGAFPRVWHVPWLEEWRVAGSFEPLPAPPPVQQLAAELARSHLLPHTAVCPAIPTQGDPP